MLSKTIADAEARIQRRNIVELGENAPVSIFALLIKPVQRLCQYPLLFKEIVREMASSTVDTFGYEPPKLGTTHQALYCPRDGLNKAKFVLASLEDVALLVNERVHQRERELQLLDELNPSTLRSVEGREYTKHSIMRLVASLKMELHAHIDLDQPDVLKIRTRTSKAKPSSPVRLRPSVLASFTRSSQRASVEDDNTSPLSKLYIFSDSVISVERVSAGSYEVTAHWPLQEVQASVVEALESSAELDEGHMLSEVSSMREGSVDEHVSMRELPGGPYLKLHRGLEVMRCYCDLKEAREASNLIARLDAELEALSSRRVQGASSGEGTWSASFGG
ncbi:MAG: hypothetical protein SGPRY_010172 [Prymnesium sp.]